MRLPLNLLTELNFAFPDILITSLMITLIIYRSFSKTSKYISKLSFLFASCCLVTILAYKNISNNFNSTLFIYNQGLQSIKSLLFVFILLIFAISNFSKIASADFYIFIWGFTSSISLCLTSNNFLCLLIGLELYTFSVAFTLLNNKNEPFEKLKKCAIRFLLLSSVMSSIFIFGCSLLYSQFGSLSFQKILLNRNFESIAGTVLILLYILFKFGLVPFHTWLLDVYEKLSFLTVMFLDTVWKLFLTFIFLKIFSIFIINKFYDPQLLFEIIAIISMAFGAIIPIFQNNINKFIATSSIGHLGFIFSVFATMKSLNQSTDMMCYLVYYSVSSICFFIGILFINKHQTIRNFSDLAGIINTTPLVGILILLSMFSMIGIPPFGNFIAKLNIFKLFLQSKSYLLLSISAIYSILAILYTAKLSKFFFTKTNNPIFIESSKIKSIIPILVLISFALFYSKVELLFSNIISRM